MPSKRSTKPSASAKASGAASTTRGAAARKVTRKVVAADARPAPKRTPRTKSKPQSKPAQPKKAPRRATAPDERCAVIGHEFVDVELLRLALTHASVSDTRTVSNERLEFLGDAVLGQVICEHLYRRYPDLLEGDLTKLKSYLVSREMCAQLVREAGFHRLMSIGKGMISVEQLPKSVLAGLFESLVGAIYLDGGSDAARGFILRHLDPHIERTLQLGHQENYKSLLQQLAQQSGLGSPTYSVIAERGPDHEKHFEIRAQIGERIFTSCWGLSKKAAEQGAALHALRELGFVVDGPTGPMVQMAQPAESMMR